MSERGFEAFLASRSRLIDALDDLAELMAGLKAEARSRALVEVRRRLAEDAFRLMVVGEFKRGKSTLINAMLGEAVLPAKVAPCTGVITVLRHGTRPEAFVVPHGGEPMRVPVSELKRFVVLQDDDPDTLRKSPYARIELAFPLPLLENNVELVDSPGLNEHQVRTEVAMDWLPKADALLMVLSAEMALSRSELEFIGEQLGEGELDNVFFLWNRYDAVADDPAEVAALEARSAEHLAPRVGERARIFKLSAREALAARRKEQVSRLARSGLPDFELALERFLAQERGRVKILGPLAAGLSQVQHAREVTLPHQEALLRQPVEALRRRYEALQPRLEEARTRRLRAMHTVDRRRDTLQRALRAAISDFAGRLERRMRVEVESIELSWFETAVSRARAREKVGEWLSAWVKDELHKLEDETLTPLLEREVETLSGELEGQLSDFLSELTNIRAELTPGLQVSMGVDDEDIPAVERVIGAVGGFLLGGFGPAIEGASFGVKSLLQGLPVYLATAIGLALVGASGGLILAAILGVGLVRTIVTGQDAADRLRDAACADFAAGFAQALPGLLDEVDDKVAERFEALRDVVGEGMATLLGDIEGQVEEVLERQAEGERALAAGLTRLQALRGELDTIAAELQAVRAEVGG
ncbi:MAG: dynamin family protein [Alphaproteobacteria bacterium]|nr:dynamin family protein [Alphaproteobacteria bacterium]MCB9795985.1 dynamin family protein [Alphaproteobacteria bacterium]